GRDDRAWRHVRRPARAALRPALGHDLHDRRVNLARLAALPARGQGVEPARHAVPARRIQLRIRLPQHGPGRAAAGDRAALHRRLAAHRAAPAGGDAVTRAGCFLLTAALAACGTTGGNIVSFDVVARGSGATTSESAFGWHVELSRARLRIGAVYL